METFRGRNGYLVLVDAYNAGYESMINAIETLNSVGQGERIGIIGSMLELGPHCRLEHEKLGERLVGNLDVLIGVGEAAHITAQSAILHSFAQEKVFHFESVERLVLSLPKLPIPENSRILVKGSGALRLERAALHLLAETIP